jgi:hypothetical protein
MYYFLLKINRLFSIRDAKIGMGDILPQKHKKKKHIAASVQKWHNKKIIADFPFNVTL